MLRVGNFVFIVGNLGFVRWWLPIVGHVGWVRCSVESLLEVECGEGGEEEKKREEQKVWF